MYRKKLEHMKDTLMCAIECEMCNLEAANTAELGEAIDMVKDLSEAIYYATITEAMENGGEENSINPVCIIWIGIMRLMMKKMMNILNGKVIVQKSEKCIQKPKP